MDKVSLKQVYYGGVTIQVPEIWDVETEEMVEENGSRFSSISITANGNDVRSIDISYGPMPEGSDAYSEACGTYEEVMQEDDLETEDEPIICFQFQDFKAYGFNVRTDDGLPCFFFCIDAPYKEGKGLLTVLVSAASNEDMQGLIDYAEEYLSLG